MGGARRRTIRVGGAALSLLLAAMPAAQAAGSCFTAAEAGPAHFRALQLSLNAGALSCPDTAQIDWHALYARFIGSVSPALATNAQALKAHFRDTTALDHWMMEIEQDASLRSHAQPDFCQWAYDTFTAVATMTADDMQALAVRLDLGGARVPPCATRPRVIQAKAKIKDKAAPVTAHIAG